MSAVRLSGVGLRVGGRLVLDGVDLAIEPGEFVGLLGANGAGKTTLMRAILGLVPPARGTIAVLGRRPRAARAAIGYVPQHRAAHAARLRGRDVVAAAAGGAAWGWRPPSRAAIDRALDLVGALPLADRPLAELSGGERQLVLLAQALLGRPDLLLLDEPLLSLDPRRQRAVVALVRRLQRELALTVLFSAHEINPLLGTMDRVLYLAGGRAAIGDVDTVITGPVLSGLYRFPVEVVRAAGRIFVVAGTH